MLDVKKLKRITDQYKAQEGSLIAVLQGVQDLYGYIPPESVKFLADELRVRPADIFGVATFYTMFSFSPKGKHSIMLCEGTACHVNGAKDILQAVADELNIKDGETTADGLFTLTGVACLGCCSLSPAMLVDGEVYGNLTAEKAVAVIRKIKGVAG